MLVSCVQALQEKVSQLQAAWAQKEKFIQSNRMILKFRDDHIAQLKKELQSGQRAEPEDRIRQLQEEIKLLREQVNARLHSELQQIPLNACCCHVIG